jgi:hypothetical protein
MLCTPRERSSLNEKGFVSNTLFLPSNFATHGFHGGWDLVEWLERCASIPKITGSNPSGGIEFTFRSDLLLTARGGSM